MSLTSKVIRIVVYPWGLDASTMWKTSTPWLNNLIYFRHLVCNDSGQDEGCPHPSCDGVKDHQLEEDSACPWKSGTCFYCAHSDCQKSHPKCDGLTYDERNKAKP
jgi:hypothetical protein